MLWEKQINDFPGTECLIAGDFNIDNKLVLNDNYENKVYATRHAKTKKMIQEQLLLNEKRDWIRHNLNITECSKCNFCQHIYFHPLQK